VALVTSDRSCVSGTVYFRQVVCEWHWLLQTGRVWGALITSDTSYVSGTGYFRQVMCEWHWLLQTGRV